MVEAIKQDNTQFISELLDRGLTIHSYFPLEAMKCKSKKALKCFMQKGWDINERISDLDPPVLKSVIRRMRILLSFLEKKHNNNSLP